MKIHKYVYVLSMGIAAATATFSHTPAWGSESNENSIQECLKSWKNHPFAKDPEFEVLEPSVKIMGIGGSDIVDAPTSKPQLVLVKTSVNVMSKTLLKLMNPNGWYCIKGSTAVLGKAQFEIHCKAHIASLSDGKVAVLGAAEKEGVAVLGTIRLNRVDCR